MSLSAVDSAYLASACRIRAELAEIGPGTVVTGPLKDLSPQEWLALADRVVMSAAQEQADEVVSKVVEETSRAKHDALVGLMGDLYLVTKQMAESLGAIVAMAKTKAEVPDDVIEVSRENLLAWARIDMMLGQVLEMLRE